jgi:long-chain-fatty-acid--[acyl-carrier-protein] ligase
MFYQILAYFFRAILSLRYSVKVKGMEALIPDRLNRKDGILFMPNHPAHVDPMLVFLLLWPKYRMRPLIVEYIFRSFLLKIANKIVHGLSIPNFESGVNEIKLEKAEKALQEMTAGLKKGQNFVIYPSGRLKGSGKELLGGASGTHDLLKQCPDANIVLIRTTGLWGSSFSKAILGRSPDLVKTLLHGAKVLLKNFIFFAPRRKVLIEIEVNPEDLPRNNPTRMQLNRYLENWYNRYPDEQGNIHEVEPLKLVSYSFWKEEVFEPYQSKRKLAQNTNVKVSKETQTKIFRAIRDILDNQDLEIKPEQNLAFDLGMDSLNVAELVVFLIKNFEVREVHPEDLETVATVLEIAETGGEGRERERIAVDYTWGAKEFRLPPVLPLGKTIPEAFLRICERMGNSEACGDDVSGVLTYNRMKKAVLVLSQYFKTWEDKKVAVMMPASIGAYILILSLQAAGKVPVMLNWTLGSRYLEEMMNISGAKRIVSSWRFLDRLSNVQFGSCIDKFVLLEDIRSSLSLKMKLKGVFLSKCSLNSVIRSLRLDAISGDDPAVILFTSGTESVPKGVPLSHKNIIMNQRSGMQCIRLERKDVLYGILPPFHSFGFSIAGLFPILSGTKVAFYPDPTDSFALAEGIHRWKITLFCSAPSFLRGLLRAAEPQQLKTIRYFISGAEKAPAELFERVAKVAPLAKLIEGYGITECSPVLTLNRFNMEPKGVGRLLPGVELITIHPETLEVLSKGQEGEICVHGPNVFAGYLGSTKSPFIEIDGKQWYRTGDIGYLDPDENLILSGRLKRFVKVGGEMISLGAIEEVLTKSLIKQNRISSDVPSLAVCAEEKEEGKPLIVVFCTTSLEKEEANQLLLQAGFSNLVKVSQVKQIQEIPLMGAGKTDYRNLQAQLKKTDAT